MLFAATIILTEPVAHARRIFQLLGNGSVGVDDHENHEGKQKHDGAADGDAVEVLLDDARARLGGVHGARDHIRDARALARVQENEDDKADAGQNQQNQEDDYQGIQRVTLPLRFQCFAYASRLV